MSGLGDYSPPALVGLISVVFVAKHVFGDRKDARRHFGMTSTAKTLCWRQVAHFVVLLSLCRDWGATEIGVPGPPHVRSCCLMASIGKDASGTDLRFSFNVARGPRTRSRIDPSGLGGHFL